MRNICIFVSMVCFQIIFVHVLLLLLQYKGVLTLAAVCVLTTNSPPDNDGGKRIWPAEEIKFLKVDVENDSACSDDCSSLSE